MTSDFDAIVIGGGHNALTAAAYLGKFGGMRVLVLEGRDILGGFATSERPFAGHRDVVVSRFGVDHMHMCAGPVPEELELEAYRPREAAPFEYLWHDDAHWLYLYPRGKSVLAAKSLDATCDEVERAFPGEGKNYRRFTLQWYRVLDCLEMIDAAAPLPNGLAAAVAHLAGADALAQFFLGNPIDFISRYFETDEMMGMMAWWASQTASAPFAPGSSVLATSLAPATHLTGKARPKGGSGALSATLADMIVHAHGGVVKTGCRVTRVLGRGSRVGGVEWLDAQTGGTETAHAPIVVSSADAKTLFTELLPSRLVPDKLARQVARIYYSDVGLCKADVLVSKGADFSESRGDRAGAGPDPAIATGIVAPGYETYMKTGWLDILGGKPSRRPALWCVEATALDPSLAPEGYHTLWLSQFAPKRLRGRKTWDDVKEDVGLAMFDEYARYAGLERDDIVDIVVTTPDDMRRLVCSVDPFGVGMNIDQMLSYRPTPALSRYRAPIKGLYLTGSGTHPGGGVTGLPGRNAALEVLADAKQLNGAPRRDWGEFFGESWRTWRRLRHFRMD